MKKDIHPVTHELVVICACGNALKTASTLSEINPVLCSNCHPFFTGDQKFVDTAGRIEKFKKKYQKDVKKQ